MDRACGPDVTQQIALLFQRIIDDFNTWPLRSQKLAAESVLGSGADLRGIAMTWDTLPLYEGSSDWLREPAITDCGCGIPQTPSDREDKGGCSDTVQVGGQCWLNGTVNYGTFGIMAMLCKDILAAQLIDAHTVGVSRILAYKTATLNNPLPPISWFNATYHDGPKGFPKSGGDRPTCPPTCRLDGSMINWDYVWEPIKPRDTHNTEARYGLAQEPVVDKKKMSPLPVAPVTPFGPDAPIGPLSPYYRVQFGDTLQKIAQLKYGDQTKWQAIYAANRAKIGPNPDRIDPGLMLTIP
jgi:hypothetical protein